MDGVGLLVGDLDAELLRGCQYSNGYPKSLEKDGAERTSSMAITTSTVSRLSRPRSFEK